jgi:hypothetical protein
LVVKDATVLLGCLLAFIEVPVSKLHGLALVKVKADLLNVDLAKFLVFHVLLGKSAPLLLDCRLERLFLFKEVSVHIGHCLLERFLLLYLIVDSLRSLQELEEFLILVSFLRLVGTLFRSCGEETSADCLVKANRRSDWRTKA